MARGARAGAQPRAKSRQIHPRIAPTTRNAVFVLHPCHDEEVSDEHKRQAARAALSELPQEGLIGIGTGSTIRFFIEALAEIRERYVGVATSAATRTLAGSLGIALADDAGPWDIVVNVDGADEVDPHRNAIKGRGGALTREKIVNASARRNVLVVDENKLSPRLGTRSFLPVEVVPFGHRATARHLAQLGRPTLREGTTDNGNVIYDLAIDPVDDVASLDRALRAVPGVVETGLFVGRVDLVIVAGVTGLRRF